MAAQSEWAREPPARNMESMLSFASVRTEDLSGPPLQYAGTTAVQETVKSTEEVIGEMRVWLKTGVAPDGTRMVMEESWQWPQDYYQATARADVNHECLPPQSAIDYYYWETPFLAHIGNINLVMMHSQVNMPDGTHCPADRLLYEKHHSRRLQRLAEKKTQVERREREEFLREVPASHHRGAAARLPTNSWMSREDARHAPHHVPVSSAVIEARQAGAAQPSNTVAEVQQSESPAPEQA
ncbi:hypothetical protein CSUI_001310 [Cystoisospora suis]|uniref:Uncharacterized protein n=1 Tax=Cystoisospora suis TaxID=483139 RepID=A0A2C6LD21_9APIC|nr:hypothetical protein CSUI_001310 [Cystoisospora suis]